MADTRMTGGTLRKNASWLLSERVVQVVCVGAANIFVVRHFGPERFGILAIAMSLASLTLPLIDFAQMPIVKLLTKQPEDASKIISIARFLAGGAGAVLFLMLASLALALSSLQSSRVLIVVAAAGLLIKPMTVVDYWLQATGRNHLSSQARTVALLIAMSSRVILVLVNASLTAIAATVILEQFVAACLLNFFFRHVRRLDKHHDARIRPSKVQWRLVAAQSMPFLLANLTIMLYMRIDQTLLGILSNARQVGLYAVSVALAEALFFIPVALHTAIFPTLTSRYENCLARFRADMQVWFCVVAVAGYAIMLAGLLAGGLVIRLLYGSAFIGAENVVRILFLSFPFVYVGIMQGVWTTCAELYRSMMIRTAVAGALNVLLNIYFMPRYGALAAAGTTVMAHAVSSVGGNAFSRGTMPIFRQQVAALNPWFSAKVLYQQRDRLSRLISRKKGS